MSLKVCRCFENPRIGHRLAKVRHREATTTSIKYETYNTTGSDLFISKIDKAWVFVEKRRETEIQRKQRRRYIE